MATNPTPTPSGVISVEKVYKYFDINTFELVSEKVPVSFTPAADYQNAVARIGNDEKQIVAAINAYLQRAAFREAKKGVAAKGASKKVVFDAIRGLRLLEPWASMKDRKEQTTAILEVVKSSPVLIENIKLTAAKAAEADEEEDGDDSDE